MTTTRDPFQLGSPPGPRPRKTLHRAAPLILLLALTGACDQSFEPIQASDVEFSVFGYLDPSAGTQWIRVMPRRRLIFTTPEPSETIVTLEDVETGRTIVLRDSVFEYAYNLEVGSEGVFAHNFWTTDRIDPGTEYRFTATRADGVAATATVSIPQDYSVSVALAQTGGQTDELRISGVPHLAFVEMYTDIRYECDFERLVHRLAIPEGSSDPHVVRPYKLNANRLGCGTGSIQRRELWIVGSRSPWPRETEFSTGGLNVGEVPTNLTNAVGFLGGVLTRLVPYESCSLVGPTAPTQHCVLNYDGEPITLAGTVRDADCLNRGVANVGVTLQALTPDSTGFRKRRFIATTSSGTFRISALDAGVRYALLVDYPTRTGTTDPDFVEHTDTLEFSAGEQRTYDVDLRRATEGC